MIKKLYILVILCASSAIRTNEKDIWLTVFIHGSFSLKPHLSISNILKMLNDSIEETIYYRSTEINRRDPFFYKNQAMGELGLHKVDIGKPSSSIAAPTVALAYEAIAEIAGHQPSTNYYTFGWSGLVSHKLRYIEAGFLYKDLAKTIKQLRNEGYNPSLRIIGYSHGGNLGLQLGAIHQTKSAADQISIDEFHMIGTPIQIETDYLITSPVFKKIYNWYSLSDGVQSLDFFSFKRFFSKKKFTNRKNFRLPEKLTQIRIKISDFVPKKKMHLDHVPVDGKEARKYFREIKFDPGHFELWFMGWTTLRYRKEFPVYPLPTVIFLPLLTKYISQDPSAPRDLIAFIQPCFDRVEILPYKENKKKKYHVQHPFLDKKILEKMKEYAHSFTPDNYNIETYNRKVYDAISIVDHELSTIKKLTRLDGKKMNHFDRKKKKNIASSINLHDNQSIYEEHLPSKQ